MLTVKEIKQNLLDELYAPYKNCTACPLGSLGRIQTVFGKGNPDAKILFIGEAPGKNEDLKGIPFVGQSGKLLTKAFIDADLNENDLYITNIVKCRPPQNRTPLQTEADICKALLLDKQILIIKPLIICTLGSLAAHILLKTKIEISKIRGTIQNCAPIAIIPTYHPAYILRTPKNLPLLIQDFQKIAVFLKNK